MNRLLRFSMKSFLIAVAFLCLLMGYKVYQANKLRRAIDTTHTLSETAITYHHEVGTAVSPEKITTSLGLMEVEPPGPSWLRNYLGDEYFVDPYKVWIRDSDDVQLKIVVDGMPNLRVVNIWNTDVTNRGFRELQRLQELEELQVADSKILSDTAIAHLAGVTTLRKVEILRCPNITGQALQYLTSSKQQLSYLHLSGPGFTDANIESLALFPNLETLNLIHCPVSENAIANLVALKKLRRLELSNTDVAYPSLTTIRDALPQCMLVYNSVKTGVVIVKPNQLPPQR